MYRALAAVALAATLCCGAARPQSKIIPFDGTVVTTGNIPRSTVSGLSTLFPCSASAVGTLVLVTDALLPALGLAVAGGGAIQVMVSCNGSGGLWLVI